MRFFKPLLLAFCFFVACISSLRVQGQTLVLTIDSVSYNGTVEAGETSYVAHIHSNDTIYLYCLLYNNSASTDTINNYLSFGGYVNNDTTGTIPQANFIFTQPNQPLLSNDSTYIKLGISNTSTNPLPPLLPTGSSVVIWPVYEGSASNSRIGFTLYYDSTTAINQVSNIYNSISCNSQTIQITFSNTEEKILQLYDATGRKVYEGESNSANADIDWSALPSAIYILRIRQGQQSVSVKLVHL